MTIKTLTTALTLLLTFFSTSAQDLDFVHSYGPTEDGDSNDRIYSARFDENFGKVVVAGQYTNEINLQIGSSNVNLTSDLPEDELQGFVAFYDQEFELLNAFNLGSMVRQILMVTDSTFLVAGRFIGIHDFDPRPDESMINEGSPSGDMFVGYYDMQGTPIWASFGTSLYSVSPSQILLNDEELLLAFTSSGDELSFTSASETMTFTNEFGVNSYLMNIELDGTINSSHVFDLEESSCSIKDANRIGDSFLLTMEVDHGVLNTSLNSEDQIIEFEQDNNTFIGTYGFSDNSLQYFSTLKTIEDGQIGWPFSTSSSNDFGGITSNYIRGNDLIFNSSEELSNLSISDYVSSDKLLLSNISPVGLIKWLSEFQGSSVQFVVKDIFIDSYGYSYQVGYYQGEVLSAGEVVLDENSSPLNNGFIMKLDPLGNLVWAHNIPSQQGELEVNSVSVNEEQDILISGYYTGNHDFDFSDITQYIGNFEEENGFLARYTQEPNEADVFLNVPILHTEIEEAGATSLVYVSINREISEDVVVEATPDEQIDLGNGEGQPVELTFTPDGEKIMSLDVTAFDDLDVEGDHTGTITFSSSGETNFASLDAQTVTFDIIDNDPDAVEEPNVESEISIYPNPATDEITIDFPENLSGKTIDLIRILDVNGRAVLEIKDHPKDQPISVKDLSKGSYILKVNSGGIEFSSKLLIK